MVRAYVLITAAPGRVLDVVAQLRTQRGVLQADVVTGEYDCIAYVESADIGGIGKLIVDRVQAADGVVKTITCLAVQ